MMLALESAAMFARTRKEIRIQSKPHPSPLIVNADRGQLEQVLLNMYVNAWQAMPEGGDLYLLTGIVSLDSHRCKPHQIAPGRYAMLSLTDTGIGMDEATRQRIFDPFFTTKEKGRGTGLGLASAYGIIMNHEGAITVESEPGEGATFHIFLPLTAATAQRQEQLSAGLVRGQEKILLVDDEPMILDVGAAMLKKLGYRVTAARGGRAALAALKKAGRAFDLVILDLIMPDLDGKQVFDAIQLQRPELPVLLSSGYAINGQAEGLMQRGCQGFIQKPFDLAALSKSVRQILDRQKTNGRP
jgi:two-component system cell cycle sensor histidine kinase/response regulator CckA